MSYAEVAVNSPMRRTFSYAIPSNMSVSVGQGVWVPFGPRTLQGIVFELNDYPLAEDIREIAGVIDPLPPLSPNQVKLARWIAERYLSSPFDAARLMLPPGFERRLITFFELTPKEIDPSLLPLAQRELIGLLQKKGRMDMREIEKAIGRKEAEYNMGQLLRRGLVRRTQEMGRVKVRPKVVPHLRLAIPPEVARGEAEVLKRRAPKQASLLEFLAEEAKPPLLSQVRQRFGSSAVGALMGRGMALVDETRVIRDPLSNRVFPPSTPHTLTKDQEEIWSQIRRSMVEGDSSSVFLLHGVTGSGKTEIYLRAISETVSLGRRAIVLVPEIALTPQTVERFASRFPRRVAVLHSGLSLGEQFDEWQRIRGREFDVVIGSRGAIFAPQPDLGIIVIDEEHEWTYKQQEHSPRYHARDVAIKLGELTGAVVILGSATPDIASYHQSQKGGYHLLSLPSRVTSDPRLPEVEVVDLREELKAGNRGIFSRALVKATNDALSQGGQVILFLNRRGEATLVQCRDCGFVLRCRRCDVSLTYHRAEDGLFCHQCNMRVPIPQFCPHCFGRRIRFLGIGTQKVEEEAGRTFPGARLLRWDRDVTRGKRSHEEILRRFISHEADILIGTQMVAKGLDLPLVTLVGVISADTSLYLPDFRAGERTFQLISQVAGRAGRGSSGGRVIVQTYTPQHYAIKAAAIYDYRAFYEHETQHRRYYDYPPFSRLARLLYTHTNPHACQGEAERVYRLLEEEKNVGAMDVALIGPAPAFIRRVRGRYRWQIIVKSPDPSQILANLPLPQGWAIDIDPVSLL